MLHRITVILLSLAALLVLMAVIAGLTIVIRHFLEKRNQKILNEKYLPMIKDKKVLEMIKRYSPKDQRALALAYLCFGSKGGMPHNEAEEELAELAFLLWNLRQKTIFPVM